jgi:VanZ family protein
MGRNSLLAFRAEQACRRPAKFEGIDKLEHTPSISPPVGCASCSACASPGSSDRMATTAIVLTVLFCAIVGALDEWHQTFTPGRSGGDVLGLDRRHDWRHAGRFCSTLDG